MSHFLIQTHWRMNKHRSTQENTKNKAPITQSGYSKAMRRKFRMMNLKKESLNVPAVTHHNEGLHRKPRMWQSKTQVQRSTQQKQAVQKNLMEKNRRNCANTTGKMHPWNTQSAHQNPQRKKLTEKQTNKWERGQTTHPKSAKAKNKHEATQDSGPCFVHFLEN